MSEDGMAKKLKMFRIVIPEDNMAKYEKPVWDRFLQLLEEMRKTDVEAVVFKDRLSHTIVIDGKGTSQMVALLMAAARGDDLIPLMIQLDQMRIEKGSE